MSATSYLLRSLKKRGIIGVLREFYYSYLCVNHFMVFYRNIQKPVNVDLEEGITIKKLSLDELEEFRYGKQLPIEFYCDKAHNFKTPFVAFVNGDVAAIHWVVEMGEYSRFLNLKENDLELNYNTVLPQFRGKRLAEVLMLKIIEYYSNSTYDRMFGVVNAENIAQYKPMLRIGFEPVEVLTHFLTFRPKATLQYVKNKK